MKGIRMPKPTFRIAQSNPAGKASPEQCSYLQILFNDLGYGREQRNGFVSLRVKRECRYLDELSRVEASILIDELKTLKERG